MSWRARCQSEATALTVAPRAEVYAIFATDDMAMVGLKKFLSPVTVDVIGRRLVVGTRGVAAMYKRHLRLLASESARVGPNGCPTMVGEFGIPYASRMTHWPSGAPEGLTWRYWRPLPFVLHA